MLYTAHLHFRARETMCVVNQKEKGNADATVPARLYRLWWRGTPSLVRCQRREKILRVARSIGTRSSSLPLLFCCQWRVARAVCTCKCVYWPACVGAGGKCV